VEIDSLFEGEDFNSTITRARFEDLCADYFRNCLKPVEKVLRDSGISKSQIDEVVLVGGSTRIPRIQEMIKEFFNGKEPCRSINPDEAVAYGAAVQAAILHNPEANSTNDILLIDVAPLSMGIETAGNVMTKIIHRTTAIPTNKKETFSTYQDNQPAVTIRVFEGERSKTADNHLLGTFNLEGIPPAPRGVPQIEVTFDLDANGILNVTAEDTKTKNKNHVVISNEGGRLSQAEIDQMILDAERNAEADKLHAETVGARNGLEGYAYSMRSSLTQAEGKISAEDKQAIETAVQGALDWLEANPTADKAAFQAKQQEVEAVCSPILTKMYQGGAAGGGMDGTGSDGPDANNVKVEDVD
jgi:L1 cell adhesion molecule like protein